MVALRLGTRDAMQGNLGQLINKESRMTSIKDAATVTQDPEKEGKRFSRKRCPKMVRISEKVKNVEWPQGP
jgi:hypothetical protein